MSIKLAWATLALAFPITGCFTSSNYRNADVSGSTVWLSSANVVANGSDFAEVHLQLRRKSGANLANLHVEVTADHVQVRALQGVSDSEGVFRAQLRSTSIGPRSIKAVILLDGYNVPLNIVANVNFYLAGNDGSSLPQGTAINAQITPTDPNGNVNLNYRGTVHFSSTDPLAELPPDYTFTGAEHGTAVFAGAVVLHTPGVQTVTATDVATGQVLYTATYTVSAPSSVGGSFGLSGVPASATANTPLPLTLSALDASGNVDTSYVGTALFASSDLQALIPTAYTFSAADLGTHTWYGNVALRTAGRQTLSVADANNRFRVGGVALDIVADSTTPTLHVVLDSNSAVAGNSVYVTVQVTDAYGNPLAGYSGSVGITSSDPMAVTPPAQLFVTDSAGNATVAQGLGLFTAGMQTVTAQVPSLAGVATQFIVVQPAAFSGLRLLGAPTSVGLGDAIGIGVVAVDAYGNLQPSYHGQVTLSASDANATLPPPYLYAAADAGTHLFNGIALNTTGNQNITFADVLAGAAQTTPAIFVHPAHGYFEVWLDATSGVSGTVHTVVVTAHNADNSPDTGYTGAVHFTSNDPNAQLPADYTFLPSNNGTVTLPGVVFEKVGTGQVTAHDTQDPLRVGSSNLLSTAPGAAVSLSLQPQAGSSTVAGAPITLVLTAYDAAGNVATGYTGTLLLSSSDPLATLPGSVSLTGSDAGSKSFTVTLGTAGPQSVGLIDSQAASLQSSLTGLSVQPAAASALALLGLPTSAVAGQSFGPVSVRVQDSYGNLVPTFTGQVHFTSGDSQALLPSDYTFTLSDAGVHAFSAVTLRTAGSAVSLTVTGPSAGMQATGALQVTAAAAYALRLDASPLDVTAGAPVIFNLTALDAYANVVPSYVGTVHFSADDPTAAFVADYTFTLADAGTKSLPGTVFTRAGTPFVIVRDLTDTSIYGSQGGILVSAAATARFGVAVDSGVVVAGTAHTVSLTALDVYGNTTKSYAGTAHLTSSDVQVVAPGDALFTAANNGRRSMPGSLILKSAGSQTLTVADTIVPAISGAAAATVNPGPFARMSLTGVPGSVTKGQVINASVRVLDAFNNPSTDYAGSLTFSSNDSAATLPGVSPMNGATQVYPVTLNTVTSNGSVGVTDGILSATVTNITVLSTGVANLLVSGLSNSAAGALNSVTVRAVDSTNATVASYVGTVHFTSSDTRGVLPADYTFVAGDAGQHTFTGGVALKTAGTQSVTATDVSTAVTGSQTGLVVTAANATALAVTGLGASAAGATQSLLLTAVDPYGNTDTHYVGTVHFSSTDGSATLPPNATFSAGNAGQRTFTNAVILRTAGTQAVTATDTLTASITGTQASLSISPGSATHLQLTFLTGGTAGVVQSVQVQAQDAYNNPASGYAGTVQFTSSDTAAGLPINYLFVAADAGTHVFTNGVTLKTVGSQSVTATDTGDASITGAQTGLVVTAAAAHDIVITGPSTVTAGSSQTLTLRARDPYGNTVPTYAGTVHFSSSDTSPTLPGDYTFVAGDSGVHAFSSAVILRSAGSRSVTATDTVTSSITGSLTPISVGAAAASQFAVSGIAAGTAGSPRSASVTARDPYGNTAAGYTGTVHFTSSDSRASLPADTAFVAGDNGVHAFTNSVVLKTVGSQSVTVTDTVTASITGSQPGISVTAGAATTLVVTGFPLNPTAGVPGVITVTATDAYGNTATAYAGTVKISSSDSQTSLPANHTYIAADAGVASFTVTLKTTGSQTLTATDTLTATLTGAQSGIVVRSASANVLGVAGYGPSVTAGQLGSLTVTAYDVYGNTATGYTGTVHMSSTDGSATLPANYAFVAGDSGVRTFSNQVQLVTAGTRAITATDTVTASITGTLGSLVVAAGSASALVLSGVAAAVSTNTWLTPQVVLQDAYGNTAMGYTGTLVFSSTDTDAQLPTPYTFTAADAGSKAFNTELDFATVGTQSLTATDTVTGSLTATLSNIAVSQGYVIGAYGNLACQVAPSGQVKCWGDNTSGDLGLGDTTARGSSLAQMGSNLPNLQLGTGRYAKAVVGTCAILDNDTLKCWGDNGSGRLGLGDTAARGDSAGEMGDSLPAISLGTGRTARAYGSGSTYGCAVVDNGAVKCWGSGASGQLGNGSTANVGSAAGQMGNSLVAVNLGTGRTGLTVNGGYLGTCALMDNHQIKCWGTNTTGQTGVGDTTQRGSTAASMGDALPAVALGTGRSAREVVRTGTHTCAILDTWQVKCWGGNSVGELGLGDTANRGDAAGEMGDNLPAVNLGTGRTARQLEIGSSGTSCVVLDNGQVKCWGYNAAGQCGLGDTTNRGTTTASMGDGLPTVNLGTGRTAKQISIGSNHVCMLLDNNTVKCWGQNSSYQLGLGDNTPRGTTAASMGDNLPAVSL